MAVEEITAAAAIEEIVEAMQNVAVEEIKAAAVIEEIEGIMEVGVTVDEQAEAEAMKNMNNATNV